MAESPFLTIIVPFHNSAQTCAPLLASLREARPSQEIELIFVDDGSSDDTLEALEEFARNAPCPIQVVPQPNSGPGSARNSGLDRASGQFVWFVDSDDTVDLRSVDLARGAQPSDVDLIAWDWEHPFLGRSLRAGDYAVSDEPVAPDVLDPIVANWFSLEFLRRTGLRFPENCIYEATPLEAFVLPLLLSRYRKIDFPAYRGNVGTPSVTRTSGGPNPRFYDRLATVSLGMAFVSGANLRPEHRERFEEAFVSLFLWHTIRLSKFPGRSWLRAMRVMRFFRVEARRFEIALDPFAHYGGRPHSRAVLKGLWILSAALRSQERYFAGLHMRAWSRPIEWRAPQMPERWRRTVPSVRSRDSKSGQRPSS